MANAHAYVGGRKYSPATITNVNAVSLRKGTYSGTDLTYDTLFGFEINFKTLSASNAYQHILNVGGTSANTQMALTTHGYNATTQTTYLQLEITPNNRGKVTVGGIAIPVNQGIWAKYYVDANNVGHFLVSTSDVFSYTEVASVTVDPTFTLNKVIYLFNEPNNSRPANIYFYSMRTLSREQYTALYSFADVTQQTSGGMFSVMQNEGTGGSFYLTGTYVVDPYTNNKAKSIVKAYVGVNGVAREIKCGYVGSNIRTAHLCYGSSNVPPAGQSFSSYSVADFDYYPAPGNTAAKIFVQFDHNENIAQNMTGSGWIDVECIDDPTITFGFATSDLDFSTPGAIMYTISNPWWGSLIEQHPGYSFQLYIGDDNLIDNNTGITNPPLYIPLTLNIMPV